MKLQTVYVTVGTTKFDALLHELTTENALNALKKRGCNTLILQIGQGNPIDAEKICQNYGIVVEQYSFKRDNQADIISSDLILGHAGAGTCMDILYSQKPSLIIINEELMNNHQLELALQLAAEGYIYYCGVDDLVKSLETLEFQDLQRYNTKETNMHKFVECLNELMMR